MKSREKTKALLTKLSQGIQAIKSSDEFLAVLKCMSSFHSYSWRNTILIFMQCPEATKVAGYRKWQEMGRQVKKGQKGISILAPAMYKKQELDPETGEEREIEHDVSFFFPVCVFDISQTEGESLPTMDYRPIEDTQAEVLKKLLKLAKANSIEVEFTELANCEGISTNGRVKVQNSKNSTEKALILVHELAHELLHWNPETRPGLTKEQKEMEAEATAYVVAEALGIKETNSDKYLALYHKSYDLRESLEAIHETSQKILKAVMPETQRKE